VTVDFPSGDLGRGIFSEDTSSAGFSGFGFGFDGFNDFGLDVFVGTGIGGSGSCFGG
jgi:hypothetical protein